MLMEMADRRNEAADVHLKKYTEAGGEMGGMSKSKLPRRLHAFATGDPSNEEDPYTAVEVVPPYSLIRWALTPEPSKVGCV